MQDIAFDRSDDARTPRAAPIIVTAQMAPADQRWADALRQRHFPPERNWLPAHITLFHHLPPSLEPELRRLLADACAVPAPEAAVSGLIDLRHGVAIGVRCDALLRLRADIAARFERHLVPQDRAVPRLHITIQNKVTSQIAQATFGMLRDSIRPRPLAIAGLACWFYAGGPWRPIARWRFRPG